MNTIMSAMLVATIFGLLSGVIGVIIFMLMVCLADYIAAYYYKGRGWYNPMWVHEERGKSNERESKRDV